VVRSEGGCSILLHGELGMGVNVLVNILQIREQAFQICEDLRGALTYICAHNALSCFQLFFEHSGRCGDAPLSRLLQAYCTWSTVTDLKVELADWGSQEILFDRRTMRDRLAASS
jgi:hypothetical protein